MSDIEGRESPEMYLKTIYSLWKEKGYCRSVDIARRLDISRPSVSVAVNKLRQEDCLTVNEDGMLLLTERGRNAWTHFFGRPQVILCYNRKYRQN